MNIKPVGERILIKIKKSETRTKGGIYIPDTALEKTQEGTVIAIGDNKDKIKVKVNDKILFDKYSGTSVKINQEEHLILKMDDILGIIV